MFLRVSLALGALILSLANPALSACVSGQEATYDDITAVMFQHGGCGSTLAPRPKNPPLDCSFYRLVFWTEDNGGAGNYAQYSQRPDRGTYTLDVRLGQAVALLRNAQFFLLNPGEHWVTDMNRTGLTVVRCGVITRLMMFPMPDLDPKVNALFANFDALVKNARKTKLSNTPEDYPYMGVFQ